MLIDRTIAWKIIFIQLLVVLATAGGFGLHSGAAVKSALLGGIICIITTVIFTLLVFQHAGAQAAKKIVRNFYVAELLKFITTIVLFVLVLRYYPLAPIPFFAAYVLAHLGFWLSLLWVK